ncbi:hypothetical protein PDJAM_G00200610 [Pangasius djambal]|uniref:Uncharacterized protein n=1 Tax=Pangasius djambal TaxID=1691987 RepID=A0ACC5Y7F2_9TELE|nr:hypothetical protein [Pangasius djambal]
METEERTSVCKSLIVLLNLIAWMLLITAVGLGAMHLSECPIQPYIPIYLIIIGGCGIILLMLAYWTNTLHEGFWCQICILSIICISVFSIAWFLTEAMAVAELVAKCLQARDMAYCPYSQFPVGAAILTSGGAIITGCNVENASYGLTVCAERTAIQRAVAEGHRSFTAIAVTCDIKDSFVGPCGACRQVLMEFGTEWDIYLTKPDGSYKKTSLRELLPLAFSPAHLAEDGN